MSYYCLTSQLLILLSFYRSLQQEKLKSMITVHPQYIKDAEGKNSLVVLTAGVFDIIMEELEDMNDILLYDVAKKEDTGERILFSDYLRNRKQKNA